MVSGIKAKDIGSLVMTGPSTSFHKGVEVFGQSAGGEAFVPPLEAWAASAVRKTGRWMFVATNSQIQSGGCETGIKRALRESMQNAASH
jgi:hypothetical protein